MNRVILGALVITIAAVCPSSAVHAQYRPGPTGTVNQRLFQYNERQVANEERVNEKVRFTQEQKAASDLKMQSGLNLLREAKASLESNNMPATASNLVAAYEDMYSAIPHYYGHRAASLRATHNTYFELRNSNGRHVRKADARLDNAIREAEKALEMW